MTTAKQNSKTLRRHVPALCVAALALFAFRERSFSLLTPLASLAARSAPLGLRLRARVRMLASPRSGREARSPLRGRHISLGRRVGHEALVVRSRRSS